MLHQTHPTPRGLFDVSFLFTILVACLLGGAGTITGPIIGAFLLTLLLEFLRPYIPGSERYLIYGTATLVLYVLQPRGIHRLIQIAVNWFVEGFMRRKST